MDPVTGKLTLMGTDGSSSGGYLAFTLKHAALALFNISVSYSDIENGKKHGILIDKDPQRLMELKKNKFPLKRYRRYSNQNGP